MNKELPHYLVAIDPGGSTGFAFFKNGLLYNVGITKGLEQCFTFLSEIVSPTHFVVEDFRVNPRKNLAWNQLIAPRVIGVIEYIAWQNGAVLVKQSPSIKPVAFGLAGMKYKKGAGDAHIQDAVAHGVYYLHKEFGYVAAQS